MIKDYINAITVTNKLMAFIFVCIWLCPGGIQFILIKLNWTGMDYNRYLVKHYELFRQSQITWLAMQNIEVF